jgi:dTDP-4-amino-4,6-dideoxygalactose transaminase
VAEDFAARALSLPLYPALSERDVQRVIETVCAAARALL